MFGGAARYEQDRNGGSSEHASLARLAGWTKVRVVGTFVLGREPTMANMRDEVKTHGKGA